MKQIGWNVTADRESHQSENLLLPLSQGIDSKHIIFRRFRLQTC